jgi:mono/diheme cytochrome c family protein
VHRRRNGLAAFAGAGRVRVHEREAANERAEQRVRTASQNIHSKWNVRNLRIPIAAGVLLLLTHAVSAQEAAKVEAGEGVYRTYCSPCHGDNLVSSGQTFDLRRLTRADRARFENSVLNGKNQMPPWKGALSNEEIDQIWHYIRATAEK